MKKKHILYGTAAVLASAALGTATVSADTFIINVDGVQTQVAEYDNGLSAETLAAIEASLIDNNLANGLRYDSADFSTPGTRIYNFTSPTAETPAEAEKPAEVVPAAEKLEDYKLIVTVDGQEVQASDFSLIAYSELEEHQSALVEAKLAEGLTFDAIDRVGNAFTLSFSTPAEVPAVNSEWVPNDYVNSNKEVAENFKIVVEVDGKEVQVSDFEAITYSDFVNHLAALTEAKLAEGLAYDGNAQVDNVATLSFSTPAEAEKPAVSEELENFKIIVKVDGKEVQVSDFEAITYSDFVNHLAALTEAKLAEDLTYVSADYVGNTVTLSFETAVVSEWVEDDYVNSNKDELKNPAKEDETSTDVNDDKKPTVKEDSDKEVVADKEETTEKKAEDKAKDPAVALGNKKAAAKKDAQYAKDATLPSTGDNNSATFAIAGLAIMGLGLAGVAKRKFNK